MQSIYPEFALYGGKNECAKSDTVFFPISQVCPMGVSLKTQQVRKIFLKTIALVFFLIDT